MLGVLVIEVVALDVAVVDLVVLGVLDSVVVGVEVAVDVALEVADDVTLVLGLVLGVVVAVVMSQLLKDPSTNSTMSAFKEAAVDLQSASSTMKSKLHSTALSATLVGW